MKCGRTTTAPRAGGRRTYRGGPGRDYGYLVNGEGPFPDPRSQRQPDGVHALSRTFDATSYAWNDSDWAGRGLGGAVIYELHLGTFTPEGTLDAAAGKLDYLVELGIDFVELLPVNAFNGPHNWGYDGVLWFAVHEAYGGPEAYQRFVDAAHAAGLGVIQDVVYNHLGPSGNYLPKFGPYLKSGEGNTWGDSVNLDGPGSDEVRQYILDNAAMWLRDFHVDGLRLDAVHALRDERAVHILEDLASLADRHRSRNRRAQDPDRGIGPEQSAPHLPPGHQRLRSGGQWSDDFHHAVHVNLSGETAGYYADFDSLAALAKVLEHGFFHDGSYSSFRGRHHGRPIRHGAGTSRRTGGLQPKPRSDRKPRHRRPPERKPVLRQAGLAAVLTMTSPFTPMLFMGEEFGASTPWQFFTSHPGTGLARPQPRAGSRSSNGWAGTRRGARPPGPGNVLNAPSSSGRKPRDGDHARLLELYRELATAAPERRRSSRAADSGTPRRVRRRRTNGCSSEPGRCAGCLQLRGRSPDEAAGRRRLAGHGLRSRRRETES